MIKTERLSLAILHMEDTEDVFQTLNDKYTADIISFFHWPMTREQAASWCRKAEENLANKTGHLFIARQNGKPAGCIGIHPQKDPGRAEIGYWVTREFQGQGMATEMLRGVIGFSFNTLGLEELFATTALNNPASDAVLLKNGFKESGTADVPLPGGSLRPSKLFIRKRAEKSGA